MTDRLERNKQNAIAFYKTAFDGEPRKAAEQYVGGRYIQHNPALGDGVESFIAYFEKVAKEHPDRSIEFVRAIAEGDLVALHAHIILSGNELVGMDFFRLDENGKVVEHQDIMTEIPEKSENNNTMY